MFSSELESDLLLRFSPGSLTLQKANTTFAEEKLSEET